MFENDKINFNEIIDNIVDGIFIIDKTGRIVAVNNASAGLTILEREEMLGKNMYDLVEEGIFKAEETASIESIEKKSEVVKLQQSIKGKYDILATAKPVIKNGETEFIVVTERDVTEISVLKSKVEESLKHMEKYKSELNYYREQNIQLPCNIIAKSESMYNVIKKAMHVGGSDATVIIEGETGVGKEVLAKIIQNSSKRRNGPFIKINCSTIPESLMESEMFGYEKGAFTGALNRTKLGIFELANEGTLFLDEIDSIPVYMQSKLLRVLQEGTLFRIGGDREVKVDVRIIATTNKNLKTLVKDGLFREDLYYRLNVVPIVIPPLRARKEDIYPLANEFLKQFNDKYGEEKRLSVDAVKALCRHDWPGNVRELENLMERIVVSLPGDLINSDVINSLFFEEETPISISNVKDNGLKKLVYEFEKQIIMDMMHLHKNAKSLAEALKLDKSTLNRKIQKYNIDVDYRID